MAGAYFAAALRAVYGSTDSDGAAWVGVPRVYGGVYPGRGVPRGVHMPATDCTSDAGYGRCSARSAAACYMRYMRYTVLHAVIHAVIQALHAVIKALHAVKP